MAIFEFIGGILTNSTAIMSDALHDFGDSLSLGLSWYLERVSNRKGDRTFSFGYRRFSLLAAFINSFVLIVGSIWVLTEVIPRLIEPADVHAEGMMYFAIVGLIVNGFSAYMLSSGRSLNERIVTWHLMEDVLGWTAVFIVSIVLQFKDIPILDPILAILVMSIILFNVFKNFKRVFMVFMQSTPENMNKDDIESALSTHDKVDRVYHTHIWSLDGERHVLTTHICLKKHATAEDHSAVQLWAREEIKKFGLWHSTIEIEFTNND